MWARSNDCVTRMDSTNLEKLRSVQKLELREDPSTSQPLPAVVPTSPSPILTSSITLSISSTSTTSTTFTTSSQSLPSLTISTLLPSPSATNTAPAIGSSTQARPAFGSNRKPQSPQNLSTSATSDGPQDTSTSVAQSSPTSLASSPSSRLPNGAVAGIAIGAALGLALITFFLTYCILNRRQRSRADPINEKPLESDPRAGQQQHPRKFELPILGGLSEISSLESHLPQPADDKAITTRTATLLDQLDLHVENFYKNVLGNASSMNASMVDEFDTGQLSSTLSSAFAESREHLSLVKHALIHATCESISTTSHSGWSLLPDEFTLLARSVLSSSSEIQRKAGKYILSPMVI